MTLLSFDATRIFSHLCGLYLATLSISYSTFGFTCKFSYQNTRIQLLIRKKIQTSSCFSASFLTWCKGWIIFFFWKCCVEFVGLKSTRFLSTWYLTLLVQVTIDRDLSVCWFSSSMLTFKHSVPVHEKWEVRLLSGNRSTTKRNEIVSFGESHLSLTYLLKIGERRSNDSEEGELEHFHILTTSSKNGASRGVSQPNFNFSTSASSSTKILLQLGL